MFKGAYLITNVEHNITPNDFTTKFTGVRVSKYNIPLNKISMDISRIGSIVAASEQNRGQGSTNSTVGTGQPVNIDTTNDSVNLESGHSCFFKYEYDCSKKSGSGNNVDPNCGKEGHEECCDCHRSAILSVKCLLNAHNITDDGTYANANNSIKLLYEDTNDSGVIGLYYFARSGEEISQKYKTVVNNIIYHLDNERPVIVGVNHTYGKEYLNEGTSDHWVTIYAYGYSGGTLYFRYYETGSNSATSTNRDDIFLYKPGEKPLLYNNRAHPPGGKGQARRYDVTVVKLWYNTSTLGLKLANYNNEDKSISKILMPVQSD